MKRFLSLILLAMTALSFAQEEKAKPASEEPSAKQEADPRFKDVPQQNIATLLEMDKENPKLVASWVKIRQLQQQMVQLNDTFGLQKRKQAERDVKSLGAELTKEMDTFRKLFDKERLPLVDREATLKDQAFRMSQKPESPSGTKKEEEEKKITALYEETGKLGERIRALDQLELMISKMQMPDRLEQLGIGRNDTFRPVAQQYAGLIEKLLTVKDCLADLQELKTREGKADQRMLAAAQLNLEKAGADLEKEAAALKKPTEMEMAKAQKQLDSLKEKVDTLAKRNRPTEQYDEPLTTLEATMAELTARVESITELADWQKLKPPEAEKPAAAKE